MFSGPWKDDGDVPFMVECSAVTCPQLCDQTTVFRGLIVKGEYGALLLGWFSSTKEKLLVLLAVQHSQDASADKLFIIAF